LSEELGARQSPEKKIQNDVQYAGLTGLLADHTAMQCLLEVIGLNLDAVRRPKKSCTFSMPEATQTFFFSSSLSCHTQQTKLGDVLIL